MDVHLHERAAMCFPLATSDPDGNILSRTESQ